MTTFVDRKPTVTRLGGYGRTFTHRPIQHIFLWGPQIGGKYFDALVYQSKQVSHEKKVLHLLVKPCGGQCLRKRPHITGTAINFPRILGFSLYSMNACLHFGRVLWSHQTNSGRPAKMHFFAAQGRGLSFGRGKLV